MEDKEIIDLYFARSEAAIPATAEKYGRMIRAIAYGILKNNSDSEECENDTYLAAWNSLPPQLPRVLSAYLGRIVRNISINRYEYLTADKRCRDFEVTLDELGEILPGIPGPECECEAEEVSHRISDWLRSKNQTKRRVFVRRYWYCDPIGKIAVDFGFSESKVKSMLMRMRNELKIYLERNGIKV